MKQPSGVGGGGAVPARLLLPVNLGRGMLLKIPKVPNAVVQSLPKFGTSNKARTFGEEEEEVEDLWGCGWWWWLNEGAAVGGGGRGSSSTESRGCCEPDRRVDDEEDLRRRGNEEIVKNANRDCLVRARARARRNSTKEMLAAYCWQLTLPYVHTCDRW